MYHTIYDIMNIYMIKQPYFHRTSQCVSFIWRLILQSQLTQSLCMQEICVDRERSTGSRKSLGSYTHEPSDTWDTPEIHRVKEITGRLYTWTIRHKRHAGDPQGQGNHWAAIHRNHQTHKPSDTWDMPESAIYSYIRMCISEIAYTDGLSWGCSTESAYTLRSKGAKWHLLGIFGLSLYWHPQMVLQRTLLEGSFEITLLRTLMWGSLKEP